MLQILLESVSLILALLTGLVAQPRLSPFLRRLLLQLSVWIFFYILAYDVTAYQQEHQLTINNNWLFNLCVPIEFWLLSRAALCYFSSKPQRRLIYSAYGLYLLCHIIQLVIGDPTEFANYATSFGNTMLSVLYIAVIYHLWTSPHSGKNRPELIASLGILLYLACNVPYLSALSYLSMQVPDAAGKLFRYINDNLANIRYLSLAFAFWLARRQAFTHNAHV